MNIKRAEAAELLNLVKFEVDAEEPHILVDKSTCRRCKNKPCVMVCPAGLYRMDKNEEIVFDYAGCLECGTCRIICNDIGNKGITKWQYPRGTFGVVYRYG